MATHQEVMMMSFKTDRFSKCPSTFVERDECRRFVDTTNVTSVVENVKNVDSSRSVEDAEEEDIKDQVSV
jgi:hypothetical protein